MHKEHKILFIDDSHTEINYLKLLFQIIDFPAKAEFMVSASDALLHLDAMDEDQFPDFIIVDINMPFINGFEFAEKFLTNTALRYPDTKLFIYSTSLHSKDINKAKSIDGVTGFINKPFDQNSFDDHILPLIDNSNSTYVRVGSS